MFQKRNDSVNELALKLKEILELEVPIDIDKVVADLNGKISYEDDRNSRIEKVNDSDCDYKIVIFKSTFEAERRFEVAHKLGHLFLHMGYLIDEEKWSESFVYKDSAYYRYGHNVEEYEANEFAAVLLMPRKEFFKVAKAHLVDGTYDVERIADYFGVPSNIAKERGRWLGLFSWHPSC